MKVFFNNSKGDKICGILEDLNKDKIVIIVHGYSSNKDRVTSTKMAEKLNKRNISTLRIDLYGCGESDGEFEDGTVSEYVDDLNQAINFVKDKGFKDILLFGSSCGGITCLGSALSHPEIVKMALKAPVSDYYNQKIRKKGEDGIKKWRENGSVLYKVKNDKEFRTKYQFFEDSKKWIMYDKVHKIKFPVLILHGDADETVLVEDSKKLVDNLENGQLIIVEGANHQLEVDGSREESYDKFVDWLCS